MKVGDKAKGFKFDVDLFPHFTHDMIKYIGEEGVISDIDNRYELFTIKFNEGDCWNYPLSLSHLSQL
jgi:hypothetical protein